MDNLIRVAIVAIVAPDFSIAVTSRKEHDNKLWGLVGGHVEDSETYQDAARREAFEETGLLIFNKPLSFVKSDMLNDKYMVNAYKTYLSDKPELTCHETDILAQWMTLEEFKEVMAYPDFNRSIIDELIKERDNVS